MKQNYLHDQRGVAMLLELVLVAAVLGLVGVALYQSNQHNSPAASVSGKPAAVNPAVDLANSAAKIGETESTNDANISDAAESSANIVTESDVDVSNLGGSTSANSF